MHKCYTMQILEKKIKKKNKTKATKGNGHKEWNDEA